MSYLPMIFQLQSSLKRVRPLGMFCGMSLTGLLAVPLTRLPVHAQVIPAAPARAGVAAQAGGTVSTASPSIPATSTPPSSAGELSPALYWDNSKQGGWIMSLARDQRGDVWVGTEDSGVWRYTPSTHSWIQFTTRDGLGDNNGYALACDRKGRIWVGHLNHGVSVFNGKTWRCYGVVDGPLGSRVFAIASCPTDGDIWIATEGGLSRYSLKGDSWSYYTRAEGLPSDQANAIAFDQKGKIFLGTQCDGIAMASPHDGYATWQQVTGPDRMPNTPGGAGLPTSLINCLLVSSHSGIIYAGTTTGLARSEDGGKSWRFLRGADWEAKVLGLYHGTKPHLTDTHGQILAEDYITALTEDQAGRLWIGYRQRGYEVVDQATGSKVAEGKGDYVTALLPLAGESCLVAQYGGGLGDSKQTGTQSVQPVPPAPIPKAGEVPPLPTAAGAPSLQELNALLEATSKAAANQTAPLAATVEDDWVTQGDWLGRYGRYWAYPCAMTGTQQYYWGAGWEWVDYWAQIGPNHPMKDSLRFHVTKNYVEDRRSLEMPLPYLQTRVEQKLTTWDIYRRQAELDDHGEVYPMTLDSPHLYFNIRVPYGLYYLSLYDFNKDGHWEFNRYRDYRISLRPHPEDASIMEGIDTFSQRTELAHSRVSSFWGGVWKRFLVSGPAEYSIEINRNGSFDTILCAFTLDLVDERPPPYFQSPEQWLTQRTKQRKDLQARGVQIFTPALSAEGAAGRFFDMMEGLRLTNPIWWALHQHRVYGALLRWYRARLSPASPIESDLIDHLGTCYYQMGLYAPWEQCQKQLGLTPAREIEKALRPNLLDSSLKGYEIVSDYLASHSGSAATAAKTAPDSKRKENLGTKP